MLMREARAQDKYMAMEFLQGEEEINGEFL
jgi:hypothetical protein